MKSLIRNKDKLLAFILGKMSKYEYFCPFLNYYAMTTNYESPKTQEIDLIESGILCLSISGEGNMDNVDREDFEW